MSAVGRPSIPKSSSAFYAERLRTPQIIRLSGAANGAVRIDGGDPVALPITLIPSSTWVSTTFVTSETLPIGLVNCWSDSGAFHVRKADQSLGQEASGFVLSAFGSGVPALVYFTGILSGLSGLTPGKLFLANAGLVSATAGTTAGQEVGWAHSATEMVFQPKEFNLL